MKKSSVFTFLSLIAVTVIFSSCCSLGKMGSTFEAIEYKVTPEVLEMHADSVDVTISVTFPEKCFCKKAIVEATPTLKWEGGEKAFKPETMQGESVEDNYKVISWDGGSISYNDKVGYEDAMRVSDLVVKIKGTIKGKDADIIEKDIADGVIATPTLATQDGRAILGPDKFVRITKESKGADIHFLINQSQVRGKELKQEDVDLLLQYIQETADHERRELKSMDIDAYASPDGEEDKNQKLAEDRAKETDKLIQKKFKKIEEVAKEGFIASKSTAEDWAGFQKLMKSSEMEDAQLILKVLDMYSDPTVRETEIKKLAKVYLKLADDILPQLRRSKMNVNIEIVGYSDEEITAISDSKPDSLNVEELLYAATLTDNNDKKLKIYQDATSIFKDDWRGPNNAGFCLLKASKVAEAKTSFEEAKARENSNTTIINNLGAIALREGDQEKAKELLESAAGAGNEVSYNLGIISIKKAGFNSPGVDYNEAVTYFKSGEDCSFNSALAKTLAGSLDDAIKAVDCAMGKCWSINEEEGKKYDALLNYLKAVIYARQDNTDGLFNSLRAAVEVDASLAQLAKTDLEFGKYFEDATFTSIVK